MRGCFYFCFAFYFHSSLQIPLIAGREERFRFSMFRILHIRYQFTWSQLGEIGKRDIVVTFLEMQYDHTRLGLVRGSVYILVCIEGLRWLIG